MAPSVDDPKNLNNFLALIGGHPLEERESCNVMASGRARSTIPNDHATNKSSSTIDMTLQSNATDTDSVPNITRSTIDKTLQPDATDDDPILNGTTSTIKRTVQSNATDSDPILNSALSRKSLQPDATDIDQVLNAFVQNAENGKLTLMDSKYAPRGRQSYQVQSTPNSKKPSIEPSPMHEELLAKRNALGGGENWQDQIVQKHKENHQYHQSDKQFSKGDHPSDMEDREHATHFQSWGTPDARNRPEHVPRKIILSGLPADADFTLVQSLIHGSSIESMTLTPSGTAYVLLTSGQAAKEYYDQYPNGIQFKYKDRLQTAFVDMGKEADIISSVMANYLACGASRAIRTTGANEDWGIRALYKVAEGQSKNKRKVESIVDIYKNEVQTIVFRFTNVPDAVQFRGVLLREDDWEMCNIQFMDDPFEKATGIRVGLD